MTSKTGTDQHMQIPKEDLDFIHELTGNYDDSLFAQILLFIFFISMTIILWISINLS